MEAYMTIVVDDRCNKDFKLSLEYVIDRIKKKINYGLIEKTIKDYIDNERYNEKVCIAKGKPPVDGKDGKINYYFDINKKMCPKIKKDGSVDYRELDIITNVKEGDLLAEIIPPKEGEIGYKVTGEEIPYKKGKKPFLKHGENVKLSNDGLKFQAAKDGMVKVLNNRISVLDILEVPAVDNSTGNIYFNGSVIVKGNVINGFSLRANGDIEVKGVVEGAFLDIKGDILIRRGIQGYSKARIHTDGRLTTRFIENSFIKAKDTITAEVIMHSEIESHKNIELVGKKGLIVGGICKAQREIHAKTVGSSMATITVLQIGVDTELKTKYTEIQKKQDELKNNLKKVKKTIKLLEAIEDFSNVHDDKEKLQNKLINTKKSLEEKLLELDNELFILKTRLDNLYSGEIKVKGIVYPGVRIIIGDEMKIIKDEIEHCRFYLEDGEIKVGPY